MHKQPDLFSPALARVHARQGRLFDTEGPADLVRECPQYGRPLVRTQSGYLSCPRACGKLVEPDLDASA